MLLSTISVILMLLLIMMLFLTICQNRQELFFSIALFATHSAFFFIFLNFVSDSGSDDSFFYYRQIQQYYSWVDAIGFNRHVLYIIAYPFVNLLELPYSTVSYLFSLIGFLGIWLIAIQILRTNPAFIFPMILLFLPTLHFWTAALSKEALSVFAIGLVSWGIDRKLRYVPILVGLTIATALRPYLGILIGVSFVLMVVSGNNLKPMQTLILTIVISGMSYFAMIIFSDTVGLSEYGDIEEAIHTRQAEWTDGGSTIDISGYNPIQRAAIFMFRPWLLEARDLRQVATAIDNLALIITIYFLVHRAFQIGIRKCYISSSNHIKFHFFFFIIGLILFSTVTANLGTAARKKSMLIPSLAVTAIYMSSSYRRRKKNVNHSIKHYVN